MKKYFLLALIGRCYIQGKYTYIKNYDSQTLFYIETNCNVGIGTGTENPSEKLEVNGKIKSSGSNGALILVSPNGTEWEITVDNNGNLSTNQVSKVSETQTQYDIKIFPNPSKNILNIEINSSEINSFDTEIYDLQGKMIFMRNHKANKSTINITSISKGIYLLKIKDKNGYLLKSEKIIKE